MSLMAKLTQTWTQDVEALEEAVVKDLCGLIASRAPVWGICIDDKMYRNTIVNFGLYNSVAGVLNKSPATGIVPEVKEKIRCFESRLTQVEVEIPSGTITHHQLPFRITAMLHSETGDEALLLDSSLDLASYKLDVRNSSLV